MKITVDVGRPTNAAIRSWAIKNWLGGENFGPIRWDIRKAFQAAHEAALREASDRFVADCADWSNWTHQTQPCRDRGGWLGGPVYECELPDGHTGVHRGNGLSWDRS